MTAEDLVDLIHQESSDAPIQNYTKSLGEEFGENTGWMLFKRIHESLETQEQESLWSFIRMVQSDSIASILSILDNQTFPEIQKHDLRLTHGADTLNGDLCDIYWEKEEDGW